MISWFDIVKKYDTTPTKKYLERLKPHIHYTCKLSVILKEKLLFRHWIFIGPHLPESFFHLIQWDLYNVFLNCYQVMLLRQRLLHRLTILYFFNNYQYRNFCKPGLMNWQISCSSITDNQLWPFMLDFDMNIVSN